MSLLFTLYVLVVYLRQSYLIVYMRYMRNTFKQALYIYIC